MKMAIWYVLGDKTHDPCATKLDAERRARELFPNDTQSRRYARVFFRESEDDQLVSLMRYRRDGATRMLLQNVPLELAREHCSREDTRGEDWFDGYTGRL